MNTCLVHPSPLKTIYPPVPFNTGFDEHLSLPATGSEDVPLCILQYRFTNIVEKWSVHLQYISFRITGNKQAAEDIVQEAFLELWNHRSRIIPGNPVGWVMKAVTSLSLKYIRKTTVQSRVFKILEQEKNNGYSDVEERLIGKERQLLLNKAIKKLPAQQQIVLHLSKGLGLKREEIAAHLQISPNTVKVHLLRAMQFVKENVCFVLLFAIFCACNNLSFKSSNTNDSLRDLFNSEQEVSTGMTEPSKRIIVGNITLAMKNISQAVSVSLNQ